MFVFHWIHSRQSTNARPRRYRISLDWWLTSFKHSSTRSFPLYLLWVSPSREKRYRWSIDERSYGEYRMFSMQTQRRPERWTTLVAPLLEWQDRSHLVSRQDTSHPMMFHPLISPWRRSATRSTHRPRRRERLQRECCTSKELLCQSSFKERTEKRQRYSRQRRSLRLRKDRRILFLIEFAKRWRERRRE